MLLLGEYYTLSLLSADAIADKVLQVAGCMMTKVAHRVLASMYACCNSSRAYSHTVFKDFSIRIGRTVSSVLARGGLGSLRPCLCMQCRLLCRACVAIRIATASETSSESNVRMVACVQPCGCTLCIIIMCNHMHVTSLGTCPSHFPEPRREHRIHLLANVETAICCHDWLYCDA